MYNLVANLHGGRLSSLSLSLRTFFSLPESAASDGGN